MTRRTPLLDKLQLLDRLESGEHKGQCRKQAASSIQHYRACGYSGERERQQESESRAKLEAFLRTVPGEWGPTIMVLPKVPGLVQGYRCDLVVFGQGLARCSHVSFKDSSSSTPRKSVTMIPPCPQYQKLKSCGKAGQ